jgi:hypothetical protein
MAERRRAGPRFTAQRELESWGLAAQAEALIQTVCDSGLAVFTLRQIGDLLGQLSEPLPISSRLAVSFLVERRILMRTTLTSIAKRKITRYTRPKASPFQLALSLTNRGYLSHGAALYLNGLGPVPKFGDQKFAL